MTPYFLAMLAVYARTDRATPAGHMLIPSNTLVEACIDRMELQMMNIRYEEEV